MIRRERARAAARETLGFARDLRAGSEPRRRRLRRWKFLLSRHLTTVMMVDASGRRYFVSTSDRGVGLPLYVDGAFEAAEMASAFDVLEQTVGHPFSSDRPTFIDIGANIGTAAIEALMGHGAGNAIAYEPEPLNFELLRHNVLANCLTERMKCVQSALSDRVGDAALSIAAGNSGDHRLMEVENHSRNDWREDQRQSIRVPLTTWDREVAAGTIAAQRVGLVWIDAQGHEPFVLKGASNLLAAGIPVVIEYWPYGLDWAGGRDQLHNIVATHFEAVIDLALPYAGGEILAHRPDWLAELDRELAGAAGGWANLLLLP